jgi:PAS domain S-box-containing protein
MEHELNGILFESVQCGIIVMDAETNIVLNINDVACKILHLDKSIIGSECHKMLCNADECEFKKNANYKVDEQEVCFMTKIQKRKWLLRSANKISSNGKNYIVESFTDITDQKMKQEQYTDLVKYAPAGIYELDLKTFKYITFNQLILEYTGYTEEEFKEIGIFGVFTEKSKELFLDRMKRLQEGEILSTEVEYEIVTKNNKRFWILLNIRFIYNGDKIPTKAFCIVTNITERKCAESKLIFEKERAQMYLDMAFDIFVALDLDGNINLINKTGCNILGSTEDKLLGLNWFDNFVPEHDRVGARIEFQETIKGLNGSNIRLWTNFIYTTKGEKLLVRWRNKVVQDKHGRVIGTFSTGNDITNEYTEEKTLNKLWDETQLQLKEINPNIAFRRRSKQDRNNQLDIAVDLIVNGGTNLK